MPEAKDNAIIRGVSETFGDQILFVQRWGSTFLSKPPKERTVPPSDKQLAVQGKFQKAIIYARRVLADPARKAEYEAAATTRQSALNVAVADFF